MLALVNLKKSSSQTAYMSILIKDLDNSNVVATIAKRRWEIATNWKIEIVLSLHDYIDKISSIDSFK